MYLATSKTVRCAYGIYNAPLPSLPPKKEVFLSISKHNKASSNIPNLTHCTCKNLETLVSRSDRFFPTQNTGKSGLGTRHWTKGGVALISTLIYPPLNLRFLKGAPLDLPLQ